MTISKNSPRSSNAIERMGHTSGPFGYNPDKTARGVVKSDPKDLKI